MANYGEVRHLRFTARDGESREYEQAELTIDGEIQLFAVLARAVVGLREAQFPFDRLRAIFEDEELDWGLAAELVSVALTHVPSLASEGAAVMLGIFPLDEHNRRNAQYTSEVAFLRKTLHVGDVIEMLEAFVEQNDIERLRAPFGRVWRTATTASPRIEQSMPSTEPSTSSPVPDTAPPDTSAGTTRGRRSTAT